MICDRKFPVHKDCPAKKTACGLESSEGLYTSKNIVRVTCLECLAAHYEIKFKREYIN